MKSQKAPTPPFTSLLNQAVFVPFCLTAVLALILLWQMENVKTSGTWVHHTEEVTSKIGSVKEHLLDSETGLRGFALTHAAEFLEPYNKAIPELNMSLVQLETLVSDNSAQTMRVERLRELVRGWQTYSQPNVESVGGSPLKGALNDVLQGGSIMDKIRVQLSELSYEEGLLRETRLRRLQKNQRHSFIWLTSSFVLIGCLLAIVARRQLVLLSRTYQRALDAEKNTSAELAESDQQFRTFADSMPHLAWMANPDGFIFWYNKGWYEYTGTTPEQMEGWGWQNVHNSEELPRVMKLWQQSIETKSPLETQFPLKSSDGQFRWFLTRVTPIFNKEGDLVRWFGTNTNIDEQRQLQSDLQTAVRARDEFLSIASHELKTPLTSLKLQLQLTQRAVQPDKDLIPAPEKLAKVFELALRQILRLEGLVEDLLDVAQICSGRLTLRPEEVNFASLVGEVLERFEDQLKRSETEVHLKLDEEIVGCWDRAYHLRNRALFLSDSNGQLRQETSRA